MTDSNYDTNELNKWRESGDSGDDKHSSLVPILSHQDNLLYISAIRSSGTKDGSGTDSGLNESAARLALVESPVTVAGAAGEAATLTSALGLTLLGGGLGADLYLFDKNLEIKNRNEQNERAAQLNQKLFERFEGKHTADKVAPIP